MVISKSKTMRKMIQKDIKEKQIKNKKKTTK